MASNEMEGAAEENTPQGESTSSCPVDSHDESHQEEEDVNEQPLEYENHSFFKKHS
jgi:hypothetical protein